MLTLNYEPSSSEDCFETKLQAKFDKSDQIFEQPEEELVELKVKQQMDENKLSSESIKNEVSLQATTLVTYYFLFLCYLQVLSH